MQNCFAEIYAFGGVVMRKKEVNMLSGSITKGLLTISMPIMIMNVVQSLFNIVDMTVLKSFDPGGTAVGSVGVCGTLISLITGLMIGVSSGANVVVARFIGEGKPDKVERAVGTSIAISLAGGLAMLVIGVSFAEVFLRWTNCPEELLPYATLYFRLYFVGSPLLLLYNFCASILRSAGDSRRPMMYLIVGGIIKIVCNYICVAFLNMSVAGVAMATIVSWSISAGLGMRALIVGIGNVKLKFRSIRFYKRELTDILRIGVPAGLQKGLYSIANVIISSTVNSFGPDATTGISIANNFDGILYNISTAPALAVMPYVSQNIGAGNVKRAAKSVGRGILIAVALGGFFGALSAIFSGELSSIMSSNSAVIAYSRQKMIIISSTYFICGINEIMGSALRGMGRPTVATVATLIFMCAIRFPWVYAVFPLYPNLTFLYLIWPIGWVLSISMLLCFYFPTLKKLKQKQQLREPASGKT